MGKSLSFSERVLEYLARAEYQEIDPWFRTDIRIAYITILYAARNYREPFVAATYRVLGIHPDKLAKAIEARRRAQLGFYYEIFYPKGTTTFAGDLIILPPKKPSVSEPADPSTSVLPQGLPGLRKVSGE